MTSYDQIIFLSKGHWSMTLLRFHLFLVFIVSYTTLKVCCVYLHMIINGSRVRSNRIVESESTGTVRSDFYAWAKEALFMSARNFNFTLVVISIGSSITAGIFPWKLFIRTFYWRRHSSNRMIIRLGKAQTDQYSPQDFARQFVMNHIS